MKRSLLAITILIFACIIITYAEAASVPPLINYQGMLTDADGNPLTGTKNLEFNLYDTTTGENKIWGPQIFSNVPLIKGQFNVILGTTDTEGRSITDAFSSDNCYLGIRMDDGQELSPRQQILSAPYSINAENAENAANAKNADNANLLQQKNLDEVISLARKPDFDTQWFDVVTGETYTFDLKEYGDGFTDIPKFVTAYYKRSNGQIFIWGLNQFDSSHVNSNTVSGILIDFDETGKLYVRTPYGNATNSILYLPKYSNRSNDGYESIPYNEQNIQFRVLLWK